MDIRVYLTNGDVLDFSQNDPALVQAILAEAHANKLFSGHSLILGCGAACTLLQPSAVSRIDLLTTEPVSIPTTLGDEVTVIEDEEVFRVRVRRRQLAAFREGVASPRASNLVDRSRWGEVSCFTTYLARSGATVCLGGQAAAIASAESDPAFFQNLNRLLRA